MTREEWDEWTRGSVLRRAGYAGLKRNVGGGAGELGLGGCGAGARCCIATHPANNTVAAQVNNPFVVRAQRFWFGNNNNVTVTSGRFNETHTGAYFSTGGTWTNSSDVNREQRFEAVDSDDVLDRVAALRISRWYRDDAPAVRLTELEQRLAALELRHEPTAH